MQNKLDEKFMKQAIALAKKGFGFASPNPVVGCVVVKNGKVVGKGYYKKFGDLHAEVNALKAGSKFSGSTVYVTLEPHSFYGKTPPCTSALIAAKVKRIVVGMIDPNPKVAGRGVIKLKKAGIKVEVGVLEKECKEINLPFIKWVTTGKPYVIFKCAVTLDGSLANSFGVTSKLGSVESLAKVHELRHKYSAIAVGVQTILVDNPKLTCRKNQGENKKSDCSLLRVVFDTNLRIPENAKLFSLPGETVVFTGSKRDKKKQEKIELKYNNVKVVSLPLGRDGRVSLKRSLNWLGAHGITSVLVEGGAILANVLLEQNLIDKYIVIFTPKINKNKNAPRLDLKKLNKHFEFGEWTEVGSDVWLTSAR